VGVYLINTISKRRGQIKPTYQDESSQKTSVDIDMVKEISILDGFTQQFVIIGTIYLLVYVTLLVIYQALLPLGNIGNTIFGLFRGFNFIIAILYGLLYKSILSKLESRGKNVRFMTNNYMLSNIASFAFNIMITGSVLAITLAFLETYGVQLIVTSLFAGFITLFYLVFMSKRIYDKHHEEYTVGLFGMLTGVASTGLALLKGIDPNLETPVAEEMVLGSGTAIVMALPLFVLLFIPSFTVGSELETLFKWITYLGILLYILLFIGLILFRTRLKK
jgi:ESS family glutamate:Na+ symporter